MFLIIIAISWMASMPISACKHKINNDLNSELVSRVANIVANKQVFQVKPNTVVAYFRDIITLKRTQLLPYLSVFTGCNAEIGIDWMQAEFQPNESKAVDNNNWSLLQIQMALKPKNKAYNQLYESLAQKITGLLGHETNMDIDKRKSWEVAKNWELAIRNDNFKNPTSGNIERFILVEIALLQGEGNADF